MVIDYLKECRELYTEKLERKYGVPDGCSQAEVTQYERLKDLVFPTSYKQFLLWMGKDFDGVFKGSEWFLRDVYENTQCLDEFLQGNNLVIEHKGRPICFFSHQGYMSAWFYLTTDLGDPACYFFSEADKNNSLVKYDTFSDFLQEELNGVIF